MRAPDFLSNPKRSAELMAPALILLAAVVAYQGSFGVPFFFDDVVGIKNNPTIRDLTRIADVLSPPVDGGSATGRPIVNLSLAINYAIGGTDVRGYHVFNLVVHAISALTLFGLVRRTLNQAPLRDHFGSTASTLAFVAALLWTVHPLQTEAVACVIQRTELLVGMFYLLTLYGFVRSTGEPDSRRWPLLTIACCAIGMASKEVMVSAPLMVLLYDRCFVAGTFRSAWRQRRGFYAGLAATWFVLGALLVTIGGSRGAGAGFGLGVSWWSYALKQCEAITTYLKLSLWPHPLNMDYGTDIVTDPMQVAPQMIAVLLLVATMITALKWRPPLGFLMAWVFAILAPSSSVVPLVSQTVAEHRMYLPLAAVVSLVVLSGYRVLGIQVLRMGVAAVIALCLVTVARVEMMQDEVGLWMDTVAKSPMNARAHGSLAFALNQRGQPRDALPHYERALALDPKSVATRHNIGNVYFRIGDMTAAAEHFRRAVTLDPKFANGFTNLGATLWELGDAEGALQNYRAALALDPNHAGAHRNAGRALFALSRFSEAAVHYAHRQRLNPDSADAHHDLGLALAHAGNIERAMEHFAHALRLRPGFAEAQRELDRLRGRK